MEYERNDEGAGFSDHQKFGEGSAFGSTAGQASENLENTAQNAENRVSEVAGDLRERAGQLKTSLADKLETGANSLRQRASNTSKVDNAVASTKDAVAGAGDRVATGMESTAQWLRTGDMASLQAGLEKQVRQNPARTLLIAAGVGYLLGRALKGKES